CRFAWIGRGASNGRPTGTRSPCGLRCFRVDGAERARYSWSAMQEYPPAEAVRTLHSPAAIAARVAELAQAIMRDYAGQPPILVSILKGSFIFAADLARALPMVVRIEFLGVQSYGSGTVSTGAVQITQDLTHPIEGQDILIVEDIVDTG